MSEFQTKWPDFMMKLYADTQYLPYKIVSIVFSILYNSFLPQRLNILDLYYFKFVSQCAHI